MVTVLLAVYNGEKYLSSQFDSLLNQTFDDFKIIVRDDGSGDSSPEIIKEYVEKYPQKIYAIGGNPTGSAMGNFSCLLDAVNDDYIMFCDQDDIWLPQKIEKTLAAMKKAEEETYGAPVLVHSDLYVADGRLNIVSDSFFEYQKIYQDKVTLPHLLVQNYVTGCTVMINRALKEACGRIPENCAMHDWWLALVAVLFGKIVCIDEPTMLYRQHSANQVGAKAAKGFGFIKRKLMDLSSVRKNYKSTYIQADMLKFLYYERISPSHQKILDAFTSMPKKNKLQKLKIIKKYDFRKCTKLRVLGQYFLM